MDWEEIKWNLLAWSLIMLFIFVVLLIGVSQENESIKSKTKIEPVMEITGDGKKMDTLYIYEKKE